MDIDYDNDCWPDEFSREEMLEQQSRLLIEECRTLQCELARCRKNMAILIDMNTEITLQRDSLRAEVQRTER